MDPRQEIDELKAERAELKQALAVPGISEAREIAIRRNFDTVGAEITALYGLQAAAAAQNAASPRPTPLLAFQTPADEYQRQWLRVPTIDDPFVMSFDQNVYGNFSDAAKAAALDRVKPPACNTRRVATEAALQALFLGMNRRTSGHLELADYSNKYFDFEDELPPQKPDLMLFVGHNRTVANVAAIIELKAPAANDNLHESSAAVIQGLDYGVRTLRKQLTRQFIYVVVTNGLSYFWVIEISRQRAPTTADDNDCFRYNKVFAGSYNEAARAWIAWLLTALPRQLGWAPFEITINTVKHKLTTYIARGQFSYAYELALPTPAGTPGAFVVKYFPDPRMANHERAIYDAIGPHKRTTQLVADMQPDERNFIVITPRGYSFNSTDRRLAETHVHKLFRAVRHLHSQGVVHNDICASNIFWVDERRAVLNDWSHARHYDADKLVTNAQRFTDFRRNDIIMLMNACLAVCGAVSATTHDIRECILQWYNAEDAAVEQAGTRRPRENSGAGGGEHVGEEGMGQVAEPEQE